MANSVDPGQTAPRGAVCSGSRLFASILNSSVMLGRRHFQMHFFFLGALRVGSMHAGKFCMHFCCLLKIFKLQIFSKNSFRKTFRVNLDQG